MRLKQICLGIMTLVGVLAVGPIGYTAGTRNDFSVTIQLPTTQAQRSTQCNYFDLVLQPGQTQELDMLVTNNTDRQLVVDMDKGTAGTTEHGVVCAGKNWRKDDYVNLSDKMGDLLQLPQSNIVLGPHETTVAKATVTMPTSPVVGQLAGGISFSEENQKHCTTGTDSTGMRLTNVFRYDFAVVAQNNLDDVMPDVQLENITVKRTTTQTAFAVNVVNNVPTFVSDVAIEADITTPNGKHIKRRQSKVQFAPNSKLTWQIWRAGDRARSGKYTADVQVYYGKRDDGQYTDRHGQTYLYHSERHEVVTVKKSR